MGSIATAAGTFDANQVDNRDYYKEGKTTLNAANKLSGQQFDQTKTSAEKYSGLSSSLYDTAYGSALDTQQSKQGQIGDMQKTAADNYVAAKKSSDVQGSSLIDQLTTNASNDLASGSNLTASESREYQQGVRSSQNSRGMTMGNSAAYEEAYTLGSAGENRKQQRTTNAENVSNLRSNYYNTDSSINSLNITGSSLQNQASNNSSSSLNTAEDQNNPWTNYASSLNSQNYSGQLQTNLSNSTTEAGGANDTLSSKLNISI
jgi:hypothetical protein